MSEERPMVKVTVRIYETDLVRLKEICGRAGYNKAIRNMIQRFIRRYSEKEARIKSDDPIELD